MGERESVVKVPEAYMALRKVAVLLRRDDGLDGTELQFGDCCHIHAVVTWQLLLRSGAYLSPASRPARDRVASLDGLSAGDHVF
jgi:hypothetical protein